MSENVILSRFCKSGDLHHLSRRFHNLTPDARRYAVALIAAGFDAARAIKQARTIAAIYSRLLFSD